MAMQLTSALAWRRELLPGGCRLRWLLRRCAAGTTHAPTPRPTLPPPLEPGGPPEAPPRPPAQPAQSIESYNKVLRSWADRPQGGQRAEEWLEEMRTAGVEPTPQSYNLVCKAWARQGDPAAVESLVARMQQRGVQPDVFIYTNFVMAHTTSGDTEGAMKAVERMRAAGVTPNGVTYILLVEAFAKKGEWAKVESLLSELEAIQGQDHHVGPYTTAMHHYLKAGDFQAAGQIWQRVRARNLQPDLVGYSVYFNLCIARGSIKEAEAAFEEMLAAGIRPNGFAFSPFLSHYAKEGSIVDCQAWLKKMEDHRVQPTVTCLNSLLLVYAKNGFVDLAEGWMQRIKSTPTGPNAYSFGTLMDAYARKGNHEKCLEILNEMRASHSCENRVHNNTLLKAYVIADDLAGAERCLADMGKAPENCRPDLHTYTNLIYGYLRRKDTARADELLAQLQATGMPVDARLLNAIAKVKLAAAEVAPNSGVPQGVDWAEEVAADGNRTFVSTSTGERLAQEPTSGIVQLTSENGPYYWHIESNTTSWEPPGVTAAWPPRVAA